VIYKRLDPSGVVGTPPCRARIPHRGVFVTACRLPLPPTHPQFDVRADVRINEARREVIKYLFHEVRTPLNSLTMGVDMLKMSDTLEPDEKEYLELMTGPSGT